MSLDILHKCWTHKYKPPAAAAWVSWTSACTLEVTLILRAFLSTVQGSDESAWDKVKSLRRDQAIHLEVLLGAQKSLTGYAQLSAYPFYYLMLPLISLWGQVTYLILLLQPIQSSGFYDFFYPLQLYGVHAFFQQFPTCWLFRVTNSVMKCQSESKIWDIIL